MSDTKSVKNDTVLDVAPSTTVVKERVSEEDRLSLKLARSQCETAVALAKEALAKNENAELAYKYAVLQIYNKYNLNSTDGINPETGEIVRGTTQGK